MFSVRDLFIYTYIYIYIFSVLIFSILIFGVCFFVVGVDNRQYPEAMKQFDSFEVQDDPNFDNTEMVEEADRFQTVELIALRRGRERYNQHLTRAK